MDQQAVGGGIERKARCGVDAVQHRMHGLTSMAQCSGLGDARTQIDQDEVVGRVVSSGNHERPRGSELLGDRCPLGMLRPGIA
jgi:hypothetical protein